MKRSHLLIAGLLSFALPLSAFARIERSITQTFATQPGGLLTVDTEGGDIRVILGSDDEVKVVARLVFPKARSEAEANALMSDLGFSVTKSGDAVSAFARGRSKRALLPSAHRTVQVSFTVTVPSKYHANLKTSGGDVVIDVLGGDLTATTSGGKIQLGRIAGKVDARTSGGDVVLEAAEGNATLSTAGGDIRLGRVTGFARLTTSGGDIDVDEAVSAVDATTSGGHVRVRFVGTIPAASRLESSGGDIVARVSAHAGFRLDARTSGGGVAADGLAIRPKPEGVGRGRLSGTVNDGDSLLKLRTSGGDIYIEQS